MKWISKVVQTLEHPTQTHFIYNTNKQYTSINGYVLYVHIMTINNDSFEELNYYETLGIQYGLEMDIFWKNPRP